MSLLRKHLRHGAPAFALLLLPVVASPADAQAPPPKKVTQTVSDVSAHRFSDGDFGNVGYQIATDVHEQVDPGEFLPLVRVDAEQHAEEFEGQWADQGLHAAWVAPGGRWEFLPEASTVESAYFENYVYEEPLHPGDRFDMAVKHLSFDTPLTWSRKRGTANGELTWDIATKVHRVAGTYGGNTSEMEVMFVRADLVARGGDFDARDASVDLPPLVIDLPRSYGPEVTVGAVSAQFSPYLHYIRNLEGQVLGQTGKAVFTGSLRGYLPEAREYTASSGTTIREWHIPLDIIITAMGRTGEVGGRSAMSMPSDGLVKTFGSLGDSSVKAPAGSTVLTGTGLEPEVLSSASRSVSAAGDGASEETSLLEESTAPGGGSQLDDFLALSEIDHAIQAPAQARIAKRSLDVRVDPSLYGSDLLGLSVGHARSGQEMFAAATPVSVTVDGETIALTRDRLVELRVLPHIDEMRLAFTARTDGQALLDPNSYARMRQGWINTPGLLMDAVYELGNNVFAFFSAYGFADDGAIDALLRVQSLDGVPHSISTTQYLETPGVGPFTYDGQPLTYETAGPARPVTGNGATMGASSSSVMTLKRATSTIDLAPAADPGVSLAGAGVGIYVSPAAPRTTDYLVSRAWASLSDISTRRIFDLPALGDHCTDPVVVDDEAEDADGELDITRSWFDFDGETIAATIEVANLAAGSVSPATYRAGWRQDHIGWGLQAVRSATGEWTYQLGIHSSAGAAWSRIADATGEVSYGSPGHIRITAPARTTLGPSFFDGEVLHDTGAVSYGPTLPLIANSVADRVPSGAPEYAYGRGGSWRLAPCPVDSSGLLVELLETPYEVQHSDAFTAVARVSSGGAPASDEPITFTFGSDERTVTTGADGLASVTFVATGAPGTYEIEAASATGETASAPVMVFREDTVSTLTVTGTGSKRTLEAHLVDADSTTGVAGRTILFFADGEAIGSAVTNADGTAVLAAPPRFRGSTHTFEAVFEGDESFLGSRTTAPS